MTVTKKGFEAKIVFGNAYEEVQHLVGKYDLKTISKCLAKFRKSQKVFEQVQKLRKQADDLEDSIK